MGDQQPHAHLPGAPQLTGSPAGGQVIQLQGQGERGLVQQSTEFGLGLLAAAQAAKHSQAGCFQRCQARAQSAGFVQGLERRFLKALPLLIQGLRQEVMERLSIGGHAWAWHQPLGNRR
jgi:hypothetical protein